MGIAVKACALLQRLVSLLALVNYYRASVVFEHRKLHRASCVNIPCSGKLHVSE